MNDAMGPISPAFLKLHEDLERIGRLLRPPYAEFYAEIDRALGPIRQYHQELARMAAVSELASLRLADILTANQHWQDLLEQATVSRQVFADITRVHESWVKSLKPIQDQIDQLQAATKLSLAHVAYRLTVSEGLFAGLDFEAIRRAVAMPELTVLRLRDSIAEMTATYRRLAESIRCYPDIGQLPSFAIPGATREVFVTAHAIGVFRTVEEPDEDQKAAQVQLVTEVEAETSVCIELLQAVDPALVRPYLGAREALRDGNPDRARHILSSLRELWNHLLRHIAPDDRVLAWLPSSSSELVHAGRPTRKARVLYVCRNLNHGPLAEFIEQDTRACVELLEFFNRVHELSLELTDEQLRALLLRSDSWLTYILQIWEGSG